MFNNIFVVIDATSQLDFSSLTKHRVPGAIPILGKYRMIDIPISAATESNITNVGVFCDRNYRSLHDHIGDGARFNLGRRVDGIFILPPKALNPVDEAFLSFQRMKGQDDYFRRSNQEYCIIMPSTLYWFPNLEELVREHILLRYIQFLGRISQHYVRKGIGHSRSPGVTAQPKFDLSTVI